ncbi:MAG: S24 family peptidase [Planctomycetota bacterium]
MPRAFEVSPELLEANIDEMVDATFADLQSQFLAMPKGPAFVRYEDFQMAYEVLRQRTNAFTELTESSVWTAMRENAMTFAVLRAILGMTPPEWADLARSDVGSDVTQGAARSIDGRCRRQADYFAQLAGATRSKTLARAQALVTVAIRYIALGAPAGGDEATVHRLDKVDTASGLISLRHVASQHVPYAVLLYERYLGRPFASHRDAISELVGDVMESAIEERLSRARIPFRKTKRAERVPGYDQTPDFFVPDEFHPTVVIEAKITGDDGTARDKATRIVHLAELRDERTRAGKTDFEVVACIDGRGFGVRRQDMKRMLLKTHGKLFTLATLDHLIAHTRLHRFVPGQLGVLPRDDARVRQGAFKTLLPVYSLRAAAGRFGGGEPVEPDGWVEASSIGKLDDRMFAAHAVGRSMEPTIHDGDLLVFRADPAGSREGKVVLAQYRGAADPETGGAYTVKRYTSVKQRDDDGSWRHASITLLPSNHDFQPIEIPRDAAADFRIVAEFIAVLRSAT